jgi:hypothetical protein
MSYPYSSCIFALFSLKKFLFPLEKSCRVQTYVNYKVETDLERDKDRRVRFTFGDKLQHMKILVNSLNLPNLHTKL